MVDRGSGQGQSGTAGAGVLGRLLQARDLARIDQGGAPSLPRPQPVTVARAATNAVARAVERLYALPVTPLALDPAAITLAEMAELLPQPALLSVLEGAGDAIGVMAIDPALMTALIEVQTLGRVTARPLDSRKPTRSDAMICADFVNALLDELGGELTQLPGFDGFGGFRYASYLDDQRPLMLMLEDGGYRSLRFRLRLGREPGREGEIFLALPQQKTARAPLSPVLAPTANEMAGRRVAAGAASVAGVAETGAPSSEKPQFRPQPMRDAPVEVVGVLCRRPVSLGVLRNLKPGQVLSLPRVNLAEARLETGLGQLLAVGKLGEAEGYHAIRLRGADEAPADAPGSQAADRWPQGAAAPLAGLAARDATAPVAGRPAEPPIGDLDLPDGFRSLSETGMTGAETGSVPTQTAPDQAATPRKIASSG